MSSHLTLCNARLPHWLLAALGQRSEMPLSRLEIANGRIAAIADEAPGLPRSFGSQVWDLQGRWCCRPWWTHICIWTRRSRWSAWDP